MQLCVLLYYFDQAELALAYLNENINNILMDFKGGEEKKLDAPAWTEDSWGLTDYTLKCRAELPSQNLTTQYVVDRTG